MSVCFFVKKGDKFFLREDEKLSAFSHAKAQLLSSISRILFLIVLSKIDSLIIKNMAYCGCNFRLCLCHAKTLFWF